jgi:hypothetical protein
MCNSNCGCGSNCDCLTLPQSIGPQGPSGADGLDAGNVIQTLTYNPAFGGGDNPFVAGVATLNFQSYNPAITIRVPENFEIVHDRLKVRAIFHIEDTSYPTNVLMGVAIDEDNFTGVQANTLASLEIPSIDIPKDSFFYMEFYMSLQSFFTPSELISFNVIGHAKFSMDSVIETLTKNVFLTDAPTYVIFGPDQRTNVPAIANFKMRLITSAASSGITPRYFSVEYCKKERP